MDDIEEELRSLPCSAPEAKAGLRSFVQLYLVDEALKKNPFPREDFYRQYSDTPEPQTPKDLPITPPLTYEESLQESKDLAARTAKALAQFYEGRVLLRREEAEQHGDHEQDLVYWETKTKRYQDVGWTLFVEVGKRKRKELNGEAEKGYAEAMILSPVQLPSSAPLDHGFPEVTQHSKPPIPKSNGLPELCMHPSQPPTRPAEERSQSTSRYNNDDLPTLPKSQKRKRNQIEDQEQKNLEHTCRTKRQRRGIATTQEKQEPPIRPTKEWSQSEAGYNNDKLPTLPKGQKRKHDEIEDQEQKNLEHTCRSKRQRRGITTTQQKQEPVPDTKSTQGMGWTSPQLRSTKTHGRTRLKVLPPLPPPSDTSGMNAQNHASIRPSKPSKPPTENNLSRSYRENPISRQPDPGYSSNGTINVARRGESSHTSLREDQRGGSSKIDQRKRQRTGTPNPLPKYKLRSISTLGEGPGKKSWKVAKTRTGGASRLKELQASRVLPWVLRPRNPISYCEVGTRAAWEREKNRTKTKL